VILTNTRHCIGPISNKINGVWVQVDGNEVQPALYSPMMMKSAFARPNPIDVDLKVGFDPIPFQLVLARSHNHYNYPKRKQ
jgi:hypothetical protein